MRGVPIAHCLVAGCRRDCASHLGVCRECWQRLPQALREQWQVAWHDDARLAAWSGARAACLEHLADVAP